MKHPYSWAAAVATLAAASVVAAPPIQLDELDRAIDHAASYLMTHTQQDGRFVYRINLDPQVPVLPRYNMLRHAGTIYALTQYHQLRPHAATRRVLLQTGRFLQSQVAVAGELPEVLAVWSDPEVNGSDDVRTAKLGGTGLGLVALAGLEPMQPAFTKATTLEQLGNFLLFMQKDDGSFYSMFTLEFPGRDDTWTSLYYPGEVALGLLLLHEVHPDPEWVTGAYEAITYLAQHRADEDVVPADHWALIATAKLLSLPQGERDGINEELLIRHAIQICEQMLAQQAPQSDHPKLKGSFMPDGRTTPTATRLEGLQASLTFLPVGKFVKLRSNIEMACEEGVRFLLDAQIKTGPAIGGMPRAVARLPETDPHWSTSFNLRAGEIRIDYVQHALSAWIQYRYRLWGAHGVHP